jgi:hypothetical protein
MRRLIHLILLFIVIYLAPEVLRAADPFANHPSEDKSYRYYVGRAIIKSDEIQATDAATSDAYRRAIKENFGVYTNYQSDYYNSLDDNTLLIRNRERTQSAFLKDFTEVKRKVVHTSDRQYLYILFRYSKKEIAKEEVRLRKGQVSSPLPLSHVGELDPLHKTRLRLITFPPRAEVFLNGQRWGVTPVDLQGLAPGKYQLKLDHPNFETINEPIIVAPRRSQTIEKTLIPAKTYFTIDSNIVGAEVFVNNKKVGETPIKNLKLVASEVHKITLSHSHTESVARSIQGTKGEQQNIYIELPYLRTQFEVSAEPPGASLYIDGEKLGEFTKPPSLRASAEVGARQIRIQKDGYQTVYIDQDFEPNKMYHLGHYILEEDVNNDSLHLGDYVSSQSRDIDSIETEFSAHNKFRLMMDLSGRNNQLFNHKNFTSFSVEFERRFFSFLGLNIGASYDFSDSGENSSGPDDFEMEGYGLKVSIPIYFSRYRESAYLSLDWGQIQHTYSPVSSTVDYSYELRQQRWGVSIGQTCVSQFIEWRLGIHVYKQIDGSQLPALSGGIGFVFH